MILKGKCSDLRCVLSSSIKAAKWATRPTCLYINPRPIWSLSDWLPCVNASGRSPAADVLHLLNSVLGLLSRREIYCEVSCALQAFINYRDLLQMPYLFFPVWRQDIAFIFVQRAFFFYVSLRLFSIESGFPTEAHYRVLGKWLFAFESYSNISLLPWRRLCPRCVWVMVGLRWDGRTWGDRWPVPGFWHQPFQPKGKWWMSGLILNSVN